LKYYRLMTSLPTIPEEVVPLSVSLSEVVTQILDEVSGSHRSLVQALLWKVDAANGEAILLKKDVFYPGGTLSKEDFETMLNLPPFLDDLFRSGDALAQPTMVVQAVWENYYNALFSLADTVSNKFLKSFAQFEVGIRNAIAKKRAEKMGLDVDTVQVLGGSDAILYSQIVLKATEADDPQSREMILDRERLALYQELEGIDPFGVDALLAYLAGAILLDSWRVEKVVDPEKMLEVFA
jgi:Protein of unknown function (DUF2764)